MHTMFLIRSKFILIITLIIFFIQYEALFAQGNCKVTPSQNTQELNHRVMEGTEKRPFDKSSCVLRDSLVHVFTQHGAIVLRGAALED